MNRYAIFILFLVITLFLNVYCTKETETVIIDPPPFASAGTNQSEVEEFEVTLNADSLKAGQSGKWTIEKGLIEDRVSFVDDTRPDTRFKGMPGETYELKWTVMNGPSKSSEATVKISFQPLKAVISNSSPNNGTKITLSGNIYHDGGEWTIEGKYAFLYRMWSGGTEIPVLNSPVVQLQGFANSAYKITWTTRYGSKSASVSMNLNTGEYLETEALEDLGLDKDSYGVVWENGHVVKLNLSGSAYAHRFDEINQYPTLQGLTYLKHVDFRGSSVNSFPEMLGESCKDLETLNFDGSLISHVASNIGKLKKLRVLSMEMPNWGRRVHHLPESMGDLESLEVLLINALGLQSLPESMSKLKNLRRFECYHNDIQRLPSGLGNLAKLEQLWANTRENIPASVSKLKNLRRLYFVTTSDNAVLPEDFGDLSTVDTVHIQGNYYSLPASIGDLNVTDLRIESGVLRSIPSSISNLTKLKSLYVGGVFTSLPASITELGTLEHLEISPSRLTTLPADINKLTRLVSLTVPNAALTEIPSTIGDLKNLVYLKLNDHQIKSLPEHLFDLPRLERLYLNNNKLSVIPDDFRKLSGTLTYLGLTGNLCPEEEILRLPKLLPNTYIIHSPQFYQP